LLKEKQIQLKDKIGKIIQEVGHMNDIKQGIGKEFLNRGLPAHRAIITFTNPDYLNTLSDSDDDIRFIFFFSVALNNMLKGKEIDIKIDVQEYFTQLEYKQWINFKEKIEEDNNYPIILENFQQIGDKIWQGFLTSQQLSKLSTKNLILYNFKTQRAPKITVSGISIDYDKQKIIDIKTRLLNDEQFPDHIKLNILNNFQEKIHYNSKTQTLTIGDGSIINIFDGYHRSVATRLAIEENPELKFTWPIIVTNLTENAAKDYMVQIDKQKPIKKEQIKSWDLSKKENLIVSVIVDDKISKLNKIMKEQYNEVKLNKGLTTKNIIAEAISENYELTETTDIREIGKWIIEFTDYMFGLYPDKFIVGSIQNDFLINHRNMFYGYIALSAELKDNSNWKKLVEDKMESINFNIDNEIWKEIGILSNKPNKSVRTKIYKLFKEV